MSYFDNVQVAPTQKRLLQVLPYCIIKDIGYCWFLLGASIVGTKEDLTVMALGGWSPPISLPADADFQTISSAFPMLSSLQAILYNGHK